ncbi:MAG: MgtC/SapB family protein [Acidobacteria bacterium]|nr:MgtC/SapB family protein [Acidobacteriota bacterium]
MENAALEIFKAYGLSILLGALMGLERERVENRLAGLRTFILVTLFGCICGRIAEPAAGAWIALGGLAAVVVHSAMMHYIRIKEGVSAGLTTAFALLIAYTVGILVAYDRTIAAVAVSLATTVILYFKLQMHKFSQNLSERDIVAMFQFGLIAFIILPVLPNRGFGPSQALNPYNIWLMVVLIGGINLVGYVILKLTGKQWGGPVLGILGGIVSSTATTLSFSRHTKKNIDFSLMGAVIVSLASTVVLVRVAFLVGIIHSELLNEMVFPLTLMFLCGLVPTFIVWRKTRTQDVGASAPETQNPVELRRALLFGFIYAVVLLAVSAGKQYLGNKGVYIVSFISGLTDVDAITLTNARLAGKGELGYYPAAVSILIAYVSNLAFKLGIIGVLGTKRMFRWTLLCFLCMAVPIVLVFV